MANDGPAPELVNVAQVQQGCHGHAASIDTLKSVCTFPDGSEDSLRLGRFCRGSCLSSTTFPQCLLRDHCRGEQFQRCKRFVMPSRWRRSTDIGSCKRYRFLGRFLRKLTILRLCSKEKFACRELGGFKAFNLRSALKLANRQVIASLRSTWGSFFGDYNRFLTLGKRINGGSEADILEATWRCDDGCHFDVVVKVFKTGSMRPLSRGLLQSMAESRFDSFAFDNNALIYKATLLSDGQFALVLRRYSGNLHELIQSRSRRPPFLDHEAKHLMLEIAKGMDILHQRNILHRDLKPCNVLTLESGPTGRRRDPNAHSPSLELSKQARRGGGEANAHSPSPELSKQARPGGGVSRSKANAHSPSPELSKQACRGGGVSAFTSRVIRGGKRSLVESPVSQWNPIRCYVADFECDGAVGTGMYRSPEVLRGLGGATSEIIESYQKHSDVYSFGMTCYELCTGVAPFAHSGRIMRDNVAEVLEGRRPNLPDYIDHRVRELIARCWHPECSQRPSFCEIVAVLKSLIST